MITFTIPGKLPSFNEYTLACRRNRFAGADLKTETERIVCNALRKVARPASEPVYIRYWFHEPNKHRDKDNISAFAHKTINDSLKYAGIIRNDGWANIEGYIDYFDVDSKYPRIEVCIFEKGEMHR